MLRPMSRILAGVEVAAIILPQHMLRPPPRILAEVEVAATKVGAVATKRTKRKSSAECRLVDEVPVDSFGF